MSPSSLELICNALDSTFIEIDRLGTVSALSYLPENEKASEINSMFCGGSISLFQHGFLPDSKAYNKRMESDFWMPINKTLNSLPKDKYQIILTNFFESFLVYMNNSQQAFEKDGEKSLLITKERRDSEIQNWTLDTLYRIDYIKGYHASLLNAKLLQKLEQTVEQLSTINKNDIQIERFEMIMTKILSDFFESTSYGVVYDKSGHMYILGCEQDCMSIGANIVSPQEQKSFEKTDKGLRLIKKYSPKLGGYYELGEENKECDPRNTRPTPIYIFEKALKFLRLSDEDILVDIGCGPGDFYRFIQKRGYNGKYIGYDKSQKMVSVTKSRGADVSLLDITTSNAGIYHFTKAVCIDILPYLELDNNVTARNSFLGNIEDSIKPDGKIFLSNINNNFENRDHLGRILSKCFKEHLGLKTNVEYETYRTFFYVG